MNFHKEKKDILLEAMKNTRKRIRRKVVTQLSHEQRRMAQEKRYPYEGLWLTLPQIVAIQKKLKWRQTVIFSELLFLFGLTPILFYCMYRLMIWQLLPR